MLPDFKMVFEIKCGASRIGIGVVLSQEGNPMSFDNKNLNDSIRRNIYEKKLYSTYLQRFTFVMKNKSRARKQIADVLSRRSLLLTTMVVTVKGFDSFKDFYPNDPFFGSICNDCNNRQL